MSSHLRLHSQKYGVVERKHRHILKTTQELLFQSHLPSEFWGECILTTIYIINRLPSPLKLLYNQQPSVSHLKTFGCLCCATVVSPKQKFDSRARQCIFIGYPHNKKGYKIFDIDACNFFTSHDVSFHESVFPFCQQSWTQSSPLLQDILLVIDIDLPTPTCHSAPEPPPDQPSSPTLESATPITEPFPTVLLVRRSSRTSTSS